MPLIRIDDAGDERLGDYRGVSDPDLAARNGLFVAEGRLVVRRLLEAGRFATRSVLVTAPALAALEDALALQPEVLVFVVTQDVMNSITGFNIHRGCLAIAERGRAESWRGILTGQTVVVVLERVANADNVGGIFRNVLALGAGVVLLDPASTDPLYRKAIRTSMGASIIVPFARVTPWPEGLAELRERGFATVAMTPRKDALPLRDVVQEIAGAPVAIVLGHEGEGLTQTGREACEYEARIPINPAVDSLNVAAAAAIALYELRNMRRGP